MPRFVKPLLGLALAAIAAPLSAEVVEKTDDRFVTREEAVVKASLKETWLALIQPSKWWTSAHTWSGDAANLTITPQGGGCFCERIPEVDEPGRFTLEGSVEHMRVIQAYPESALRMVGALGPLQSEPVNGVLTIALSKTEKGTRIVWEYNVGGPMRYEVDVISKAVDGVMSQQLGALAKLLGRVDVPAPKPEPDKAEAEKAEGAPPQIDQSAAKPAPAVKPDADAKPAPDAKEPPKAEPKAEPRKTVEDAFGDLDDDG